jgi:hypothetical protein
MRKNPQFAGFRCPSSGLIWLCDAEDGVVELARVAWWSVVAICMVAAVALLITEYYGYAGVVAAVGVSAAINLR